MSRTTVVIPPDLRRRAQAHARAQGKSLSQLIREQLEQSVAAKSCRTPARERFLRLKPWRGESRGPADSALNHDYYLYGLPKRRPMP